MGAAARRGRLTDTEAISSSILNFQFFMRRRHISIFPSGENISLVRRTNFTAKQFHSPKANFTATQSLWSPFPQGKADGCRGSLGKWEEGKECRVQNAECRIRGKG